MVAEVTRAVERRDLLAETFNQCFPEKKSFSKYHIFLPSCQLIFLPRQIYHDLRTHPHLLGNVARRKNAIGLTRGKVYLPGITSPLPYQPVEVDSRHYFTPPVQRMDVARRDTRCCVTQ